MNHLDFYKKYNIGFEPLPKNMNEEEYAQTKQFEKVQLLQQNSIYYTYNSGSSTKDTTKISTSENIYGY
jgi:hypothetical protein